MKLLRAAVVAKAWTQIIGIPVAIVALVASSFSLWITLSTARQNLIIERIPAIAEVRKITSNYEEIIESEESFLQVLRSGEFPALGELLKKYGSGRAVYISEELKDFRKAKGYLDSIGAYIDLNYIPFDIVFEGEAKNFYRKSWYYGNYSAIRYACPRN